MFAYCNNNPVMGCDPCGTCIHNWKFYDCEKCAAFWNGVGQWCVDAYNTINSVYQHQTQLQTQVAMQQNKMIADAAEATWDAYMWSYNQQQEAQLQQATANAEAIGQIYNAYGSVRDTALVKGGKGTLKIASGVNSIKKGAVAVLAPIPTVADDLIGIGYVVKGVVYVVAGVTEVIICMIRLD